MKNTTLEKTPEKNLHYKFWVEPSGNNHNLIKSVLKRRTWLTHNDLIWDRHDQPPVPAFVNLIMT